jgi:Txe/YoeB family toxin of toxin-antitoxin system
LIEDIQLHPFEGPGKPEPLKHNLVGYWSRRINQEHRIIYEVNENKYHTSTNKTRKHIIKKNLHASIGDKKY